MMMNKYRIEATAVVAVMVAVLFSSCSDNAGSLSDNNGIEVASEADAISFEGSVVSSRVITRADASLLDKNVTHLTASATNDKYVGIFGAYTAENTWSSLQTIAAKDEEDRTNAEKTKLADYYNANFFFNTKATVAAVADSKNLLSYEPIRFWPNNKIGATSNYEYCSFWAYYPWNATGDPGEKGVAIVPSSGAYNLASGMGKIKFTMQREAANQVDFLMSDLMADCNKNGYPLLSASGPASRVPFVFHHMLAQVRIYAFIRCTDRIVYAKNGETELKVKTGGITSSTVTLTDGTNDFVKTVGDADQKYTDAWGKEQTVAVGDKIPDDTWWIYDGADKAAKQTAAAAAKKSVRWKRTDDLDFGDKKYFADKTMSVELMNIYTSAIFTPTYADSKTTFASAVQGSASGTSIVSDYKFRNDWFLPHNSDDRKMIDTDYMYGTDTNADGYMDGDPFFERGNIMMVVPQAFTGDDVPDVRITVKGKNAANVSEDISARVTYNMRNLGISWESGYIYSYAFIEELMPGDDKVKGPETIIVVFDPSKHTDQW